MKDGKLAYLPERKITGKSGRKRNTSAVRCFLPNGRSGYVIYAVELKEHPGVVKVGRATNWRNREKQYANWNLADGDAIERCRTFVITEEFVDLAKLEAAILGIMPFPVRSGREWFVADFDEACDLISQFLCEHQVSYD